MGLPETKQELRTIYQTEKKPPNERVIEMQRNVLKVLGYNPDFAVSCLNTLRTDYPNDREVQMKFQFFVLAAELAVQ